MSGRRKRKVRFSGNILLSQHALAGEAGAGATRKGGAERRARCKRSELTGIHAKRCKGGSTLGAAAPLHSPALPLGEDHR